MRIDLYMVGIRLHNEPQDRFKNVLIYIKVENQF